MGFNEKSFEAGFDDANRIEEGRSPTSQKTMDVPVTPPQPLSNATTFAPTIASPAIPPLKSNSSWKVILPNTQKKARFHVDKLEDYPLGYPRVSCLMNSDISFSMYRRFGRLHSRLLLHKQDQIRELEEELLNLDREDDSDPDTRQYIQCRDEADYQDEPDSGKSRQHILSELERLLLEYGALVEQAQRLESMERPTAKDHSSVTNYFDMHQPVVDSDREFLLHKDDLITIRAGKDHAWLDSAVESLLRWYPCEPVKYLFCDEATRQKSGDPKIHYFTRTRINFFVTLIITILIMVLLVIPIGVLFFLSVNETSGPGEILIIGILMICTLVFSCVLSLFTKAKRHELLAASAG